MESLRILVIPDRLRCIYLPLSSWNCHFISVGLGLFAPGLVGGNDSSLNLLKITTRKQQHFLLTGLENGNLARGASVSFLEIVGIPFIYDPIYGAFSFQKDHTPLLK